MVDPTRGEIWPTDLGIGRGHEQSGQRPVLVVSDDSFNAGLAGLVMTVPLTSKIAKSRNIPAHIRVDPPEAGLKTPSVVFCATFFTDDEKFRITAIEVKATAEPVGEEFRFQAHVKSNPCATALQCAGSVPCGRREAQPSALRLGARRSMRAVPR
jgi:mRNA-degrading endonuclease toxin of MazEF toxin-antitoxin module